MMNAEMKRSGRRHEGTKARRHEVPECGRIAPPAFLPTLRASPGAPGCLRASRRKGFTFLEVLFSVIIIGIGFIMIAAMFPVAIQQAQQNVAESASVAMSRDAMRYIQAEATGSLVQTGVVGAADPDNINPLPTNLVAIGNQVQTADKRFGWTGLYRRDVDANGVLLPFAQVWVITGQSTVEGHSTFSGGPGLTAANFLGTHSATPVTITLTYSAGASTISFNPNVSSISPVRDGAIVLVTAAPGATTAAQANAIVGWYSKLGVAVQGVAPPIFGWYLESDPPPAGFPASGMQQVNVFVLGKPYDTGSTSYLGLAQDVTCSTGFVRINN
jgi:prepilin-type N-terminal cleavage/methylation domain-containing protein